MVKSLPKEITSYDILKTLAVLLMIVDHVGYYFFPAEEWFRVIGRLCVPMWFFLIGYARSRDLSPRLWVGGLVLVAANMVVGMPIFMLNILITILLVRLVIDPVMRFALKSGERLVAISALLLVLSVPTWLFTEYGSIGVILAMFGYMVRHKNDHEAINKKRIDAFLVFAGLSYVAVNLVFFIEFGPVHIAALLVGTFVVMFWLSGFRSKPYPDLTAGLPKPAAGLLHIGGRRTLEIYIIHLLLFKFAALYLFPEKYGWFQWSWIP